VSDLGPVTTATRVWPAALVRRRDGDEWVVGRVDTGEFVAVPPVALRALDLLAEGATVGAVEDRLAAETGARVDVAEFVTALGDLGLLAGVDGRPLESPSAPPPTLAWLRPGHVAWALHPAVAVAWGGLCLLAGACLVAGPSRLPGHDALVWSHHPSLVVAGNAALAWTILLLHELGHLITARAAGVPGRMSLSTRLQFLVAQTDVSAVWAAPRRTRLTVYLAGMAVNLAVAAAGIVVRAAAGPQGAVGRVAAVAVLLSLLFLPSQALVFMRTDLYFVLQDLARCRNLYADAVAYGAYLVRRRPADPSLGLPARERRVVRAYCGVMVVGSVACVAVAVTVTLPVVGGLLLGALRTVATRPSAGATADALAVLVVTGAVQVLWARAWWRRHGRRVLASRRKGGENPCRTARPSPTPATPVR
jgi:hypothetical protein